MITLLICLVVLMILLIVEHLLWARWMKKQFERQDKLFHDLLMEQNRVTNVFQSMIDVLRKML